MIEGKLKNGFEISIKDEALDDYEILMALNAIDKDQNNIGKVDDIYMSLLGEEQYKRLMEYVRKGNGRVSASEMMEMLSEILTMNDETKNS